MCNPTGNQLKTEKPLYYENYDLKSIVTPVKVKRFVSLLRQTGYNSEKIEFLERGLKFGFDLGYAGPQCRQSKSDNIPFTVGDRVILWNKIMKEVQLKRVAGPYSEEDLPFENYIQSPVGLVPKAGSDQTRLIFHLSYDFKRDNMKSMNFHTPEELCSVKYKDLDYAVNVYL